MISKKKKIAVIGLGYVGMPLAVEFGKKYTTIGFDINKQRTGELKKGIDRTLEVTKDDLQEVLENDFFSVSSEIKDIADCDVYIVTVPTPVDKYNRPDLTMIINASKMVGGLLKDGDIVIYESTVYPGVTEEECVPVLERSSGLIFNTSFFVGYSPERINPGDKEHTLTNICKVTSGSTPEVAEEIDQLYRSIITAGTFKAASIKVAEAAKVIENAQRDINVAFVNELAKIFNLLNIDTKSVLDAASTKWNFLKFSPGLVGGHCIGVDPYYLAQKAQTVGYHPEIILAGRRLNDHMGKYVAGEFVKLMIKKDIKVKGASILMLGITFKENCPDIRNTKAIDIYRECIAYGINVRVIDELADPDEVHHEYGIRVQVEITQGEKYDGVLIAVAHSSFLSLDIKSFLKDNSVVYDVKGILDFNDIDGRL